MKFEKALNEYKTKYTTQPAATGDTDLSPSARYGSFTSSNVIPKSVENGYEEEKTGVIGDNEWKRNKNKLKKMDWEQPEPNDSKFASSSVKEVPGKETTRLNHNKSSYKQAYKKHELPDNQGFAHLQKTNTKDDKTKGDPLLWSYYRQYFRPKNRMKK